MTDPYLYPGTLVLKNKQDIRSIEDLKIYEAASVQLRLPEICKFNSGYEVDSYEHLKEIHGHLFQDVYSWAGQERIVNIFKEEKVLGGRGSVEYAAWMDVPRYAKSALNALKTTP